MTLNKKPFNILFTSSGRRVSLIKHFRHVLNDLKIPGKIVTTDFKANAPTAFISDSHQLVPHVTDKNYVKTLFNICEHHNISLLVPLIDPELLIISMHIERFRKLGVIPLVCSPEANKICQDKILTAQFFHSINIDTPFIISKDTKKNKTLTNFPYIIKPINGSQ